MPVVEVGAPVVGLRVLIVGQTRIQGRAVRDDVVRVGQRVGDPSAPAIREPLVQRHLQRVEVGVQIVARLILQHTPEIGVPGDLGNQRAGRIELVGREARDAPVRSDWSLADIDLPGLVVAPMADVVDAHGEIAHDLASHAEAERPQMAHPAIFVVQPWLGIHELGARARLERVPQAGQERPACRTDGGHAIAARRLQTGIRRDVAARQPTDPLRSGS